MGTKTWDGGATGDWNVSSNWSPAGVPVTGDDVVINTVGCTVTLDDHIGGGQTNLGLGSLTITAGTLQTNDGSNRMLTVTGKTTLGPDSGAADQATLNCTGSDMFLGSTKTDGLGLHVKQGGTFVGGSGNHTMGSLGVDNNPAAKYTNTSATNTLNGHSNDSTRVIIGGALSTCTAAGTITITYAGGAYNFQNGNAALINNLTLNSNVTANLSADTSITGDLQISQGTLTTTASDYALTVTEDMLVAAGGTFTGNSSAVIMRSLELQGAATFSAPDASGSCTINGRKSGTSRCIDVGNNDNNFSGNGGTLTFTSANGGDLQGFEHLSAADELNNLTINVSDGSGTFYLMGDTTVTGNLTITAGTLTTNNGSADKNLTVTGQTIVGPGSGAADQATLTCNASDVSLGAAVTSGYALEVKRGGTFNGGSGTHTSGALKVTTDSNAEAKLDFTSTNHTITAEYTSADRFFELTSGTVTHSNGTIIFDSAVTSAVQWLGTAGDAGPYDLKLDDTGMTVKPRNTLTVLHDLTILAGTFNTQYDGSDKNLIVNGDIYLHPSASAGTDAPSTLICNSSDIDVGGKLEVKGTWNSGGGNYLPKGIFNGGTGAHEYGSLIMLVGADATLSSGVTEIQAAGASFRLDIQTGYNTTYSNGSGTVKFTSSSDQLLYSTGQQANNWTQFHNLILEKTSSTLQGLTSVGFHIKTGANITITSGILDTKTTDNTEHDLTSGGFIHGAGTLAANSSDIRIAASNDIQTQMTGVAPDFAASTGGINKFGFNGDVAFTGAMTVTCGSVGGNWTNAGTSTVTISNHNNKTNNQTGSLYNLTINNTGNTTKCSSTQTILGAFTITAGTFDMMNQVLTVTGNTSVTGILDAHTNGDPAINLGAFTITSGGVYKATSGTTTLLGTFDNNGTDPTTSLIHNDGTVKMGAVGNAILRGGSSPTGTTFFNLLHDSGGYVDAYEYYKVINKLTVDTSRTWYINGSSHVKLGDTTRDINGELEINGVLHLSSSNTGTGTSNSISGDNTNPGGAALVDINNGASSFNNGAAKATEFKNLNFDGAFTTPDNSFIFKCMGDMEFDAVTVSNGNTLDINGNRMECSGIFTIADGGDVDETGGGLLVLHNNLNILGAINGSNGLNVIVDGGTAHKWNLGQSGGGAHWADVVMTNGTVTHNGGVLGNPGGAHTPRSIIIGNGTFTQSGGNTNLLDITVATGGTFVPSPTDTIVTCEGDFTTSGGLIGKSALNLTGSEEVTGSDNLDEVATTNKFTIEAWFKASTDANYRAIFSRGTSWATGNLYVYMNGDGNVQASANDLSNTLTSTTAGLADGKWHHVAYTYDTTTISLYIDGKLEAKAASTTGINTQTAGFKIGDRDGANWVGNIGRVSVWKNALSETLIRKMLFMDWTTMAADSDFTDSDAIGWWQFDEGTSTAVEDLSSQSNDGTLNSAAWAGAGGFTDGSSTLNFTGNGTWSISDTATEYYKVNVAASGKTTTMEAVGTEGKKPIITNLLTHGGGTLTDVNNCSIVFQGTGTVSSGADLSNLYFTTWNSSTAVPELTTKYLNFSRSADFAGNQTAVQYIQFHYAHNLFDYNITTSRIISYNSSSFTMGAGTITFTSTTGWGPNVYDDRSFSAGPGATIKGVGAKTGFASGPNWEVVGDVINLDVTNEELTVAGTVTNCTGDIIQWHHSQDYDQRLDTDTADDRDLRLGGPALDNANALNT